MSRLTRDGTAEPVSRDQILRHARGRGIIFFPVQLTTSRIGNLTRLIHTLLYVMTIHTIERVLIFLKKNSAADTWNGSNLLLIVRDINSKMHHIIGELNNNCMGQFVNFVRIQEGEGRSSTGHRLWVRLPTLELWGAVETRTCAQSKEWERSRWLLEHKVEHVSPVSTKLLLILPTPQCTHVTSPVERILVGSAVQLITALQRQETYVC